MIWLFLVPLIVLGGTAFFFWIACLVLGAGVEPPEDWR